MHDLREVSEAPVLYLELKRTQHAFEVFPSIRANAVVRSVEEFLDRLHESYLAGIEPAAVPEALLVDAVDAAAPADVAS